MSFKKILPVSSLTLALLTSGLLLTQTHMATAADVIPVQEVIKSKKQLAELADAFYTARVKFDPLQFATINGDGRFNDQLGINIAPQNRARQFALMHKMQKQLKQIKRNHLAEKDQLNYDLLAFELESALHFEHFPEHLLPINQMDNVPSTLANFASGDGAQPLTTVAQYYAYLKRLELLPAWIAQAKTNMQEGIRRGIVHPKSITRAMLPQFQQLAAKTAEQSIYYTPIKHFPAQFSAEDKQKLSKAYQ
jgi:uncharacterized protein (DUF885 family)